MVGFALVQDIITSAALETIPIVPKTLESGIFFLILLISFSLQISLARNY